MKKKNMAGRGENTWKEGRKERRPFGARNFVSMLNSSRVLFHPSAKGWHGVISFFRWDASRVTDEKDEGADEGKGKGDSGCRL